MNSKQYIIDFFLNVWPELEKSARAVWGDHEPSGMFIGTITCPKDGVLVTDKITNKKDWEFSTSMANFCKNCGSSLEVKLSDEIIYEFKWREKLLEIMLLSDKKDEMNKKIEELKGIKPVRK